MWKRKNQHVQRRAMKEYQNGKILWNFNHFHCRILPFLFGALVNHLILRICTPPGYRWKDFAHGSAPDPYTLVEFSAGTRTQDIFCTLFSSWSSKISDNNLKLCLDSTPECSIFCRQESSGQTVIMFIFCFFLCQRDDRSERPRRAVFASRDVTQWRVVSPPN